MMIVGRLILGLVLAQAAEKPPALKEAFSSPAEKTAAVRFSPDGKFLAAGGAASIRILAVGDPFRELKRLPQHGLVDELLFDPAGKLLLSRSRDEDTVLWDAAGWARVKFSLETTPPLGEPAKLSARDGLAVPDRLKGFRIWSLAGLQAKRRSAFRAQVGDCSGILLERISALAASETHLLLGDEEGHLIPVPWDQVSLVGRDLQDPTVKLRTAASARVFRPHAGEVSSLAYTADRRSCVSAGRDGKVNLWSLDRIPAPGDPPRPPKDLEPLWSLPGYVAELSANGMAVAVADRAGVTVYEVATGKPLSFNPVAPAGGRAVRLRFSPDGAHLAAVACRCGDCASGESMSTYRKSLQEHSGTLVVWK
jgi:WD40 repeat protein